MIKAYIIQMTKSHYTQNWKDVPPPKNLLELQNGLTQPFFIICDREGSEKEWYPIGLPSNDPKEIEIERALVHAVSLPERSIIVIEGPYTKDDLVEGIEFVDDYSTGPR